MLGSFLKRSRKLLALIVAAAVSFGYTPASIFAEDAPLADHIVINQIYTSDSTNIATYKFAELYNPTAADVSLDGIYLAYGSGTKPAFSSNIALTGTIKAGGFYLVKTSKATEATDTPVPDAGKNLGTGAKGKYALFNGTPTDLETDANGNPINTNIIDFVGCGTSTYYEGTGTATGLANDIAIIRVTDGVDTNDNAADFTTASPNPRNSSYGQEAEQPSDGPEEQPSSGLTILEARAASGTVSTAGKITYINNRNLVIEDVTAAINIYGSSGQFSELSVGDEITVEGTRSDFRGLEQIITPKFEKTTLGITLPESEVKTIEEIKALNMDENQSERFKLENVEVSAISGNDITFKDSTGEIQGFGLGGTLDSKIQINCKVDFVGLLSVHDSTVQLSGDKANIIWKADPAVVSEITPSVANGTVVEIGDKLRFTTTTPDAVIEYNTVSEDFAEAWTPVPSDGIVVAGEPEQTLTYYVRGTKAELANSPVLTVTYTIRSANLSIAEIIALSNGAEQFYAKGVVTSVDGGKVTIQDSTGAILWDSSSEFQTAPVIGNVIKIVGSIRATLNDARTIVGGTFTDEGAGAFPDSYGIDVSVFSNSDVADQFQSVVVKLSGLQALNTTGKFKEGSTGRQITINGDFGTIEQDAWYDVTGVVRADNGVYSLFVPAPQYLEKLPMEPNGQSGVSIVEFAYPAAVTLPTEASGGANKAGSVLSTKTNAALKTGASAVNAEGWDLSGGQYIQFQFSTVGFSNIKLNGLLRSANKGPIAYILKYSTDGNEWHELMSGSRVSLQPTITSAQKVFNDVTFPSALNNSPTVYLRIENNPEITGTLDGKGTLSNGTGGFNGFIITGDEISSDDLVSADPAPGAVPTNTSVTLSNISGDEIQYKIVGVDADYKTYSTPILLETLPATIEAKSDSALARTFVYTQSVVNVVKASPLSGAVVADTAITLSTTTEDAAITYDITARADTDNEESTQGNVYSAPIILTADKFPVRIVARATKEGFITTADSTFNYTLKEGDGTVNAYFGQLHSHTGEYSDGAGTLAQALNYVKNIPQDDNVDFVAFTDHSNYFDASGTGANPPEAMANPEKMTEASAAKWNKYTGDQRAFNSENNGTLALPGFEMTWSGGPGHINTWNTQGIISRNNSALNSKTNDAGMKLYYETLKNSPESVSQFNHPGTTFGTFADFSYWDADIDALITMVEVGNGEGAIGSSGYFPSYEYYIQALDKGWHVAPTNNQDNHKGGWGNANTARSVILTDDFSETGLISAIRNRQIYATEDKNLQIDYKVNGNIIGTILSSKPESVDITATISDPDGEGLGTVEVVTNGGRVVQSWDLGSESSANLSVNLPADYSYYFLRVIQLDKQIAVTAPVWTGEVLKLGLTGVTTTTVMPIKGAEMEFVTTAFNLESSDFIVTNLTYSETYLEETKVLATYETAGDIFAATDKKEYKFKYTPEKIGFVTLTVEMSGTLGLSGTPYTFSANIRVEVVDTNEIVEMAIDAGHANFYISGNYADSDTGFIEIAARNNVRTVKLGKGQLTDENLANKKLLLLSVPNITSTGTTPVADYLYTEAELKAIAKFAANGGNIIIASTSDRATNNGTLPENQWPSTISNQILEAIGSDTRVGNGIIVDAVRNSNELYRISLGGETEDDKKVFNYAAMQSNELANNILKDVEETTNNLFSLYTGAPIIPGTGAVPIVSGFYTTFSVHYKDMPSNTTLADNPEKVTVEGNTHVMTAEKLSGGGLLIVSGSAFFSTFEVKVELDNVTEKQNSNYQIILNIIEMIKPERAVSPISAIHSAEIGQKLTIEGTVMSNASGYDKDTAFFDAIYVQDETGGVCVFPVSNTLQAGMKVRITGYVDAYQGEKELNASSLEIIDSNVSPIYEAKKLTTKQAADYDNVPGSYVKVEGIVTKITDTEGVVDEIFVNDGSGEARVFIDGYITSGKTIEGLEVGRVVSASGFMSYNPEGTRIRIRNRDEIQSLDATDVNNNGLVDGDDVSLLRKYIARWNVTLPSEQIADVNRNDNVTVTDIFILRQYLTERDDVVNK